MIQSGQALSTAGYRVQPLVVPQVSCRRAALNTKRAISFVSPVHGEEHAGVPTREVVCQVCGRRSRIPIAALSAHCVHCRSHFETADYVLRSGTRHRALRTLGRVTIPEDAELSHLDIMCSDLVISGKISGRFRATQKLELCGRANVSGELSAVFLSVPFGARVTVDPSAMVQDAELHGEMRGRLIAKGQVRVYAGGKLLGDCRARKLLLDPGAMHEGMRLL